AVTITVAILLSGFVSLTLTPMLCSRFLKPHMITHETGVFAFSERAYDRGLALYARSLERVMNHRRAALAFFVGIIVLTVVLFNVIPKGFIPSEDTDQLFGTTETAEGTSFDDMVRHQREVAAILQSDPN